GSDPFTRIGVTEVDRLLRGVFRFGLPVTGLALGRLGLGSDLTFDLLLEASELLGQADALLLLILGMAGGRVAVLGLIDVVGLVVVDHRLTPSERCGIGAVPGTAAGRLRAKSPSVRRYAASEET